MPLLDPSSYVAPWFLRNCHVHTVLASLIPSGAPVWSSRERITTADQDFLDIDWLFAPAQSATAKRVILICHGLEGSSESYHIKSIAHQAVVLGWDAVAMNYRGCSGEPNLKLGSYHSGATYDLADVVRHLRDEKGYRIIALVGFSLGANLVLKYAGEVGGGAAWPIVDYVAGIAAPCDLRLAAESVSAPQNSFYCRHFVKLLRKKLLIKERLFPGQLDLRGSEKIRSLVEFDDRFTAPMHGFRSAAEYYKRCSSQQFLANVQVPTLILSARDDPFLPRECFPEDIARAHAFIHLEAPSFGGHVGFLQTSGRSRRWQDARVLSFFDAAISKR